MLVQDKYAKLPVLEALHITSWPLPKDVYYLGVDDANDRHDTFWDDLQQVATVIIRRFLSQQKSKKLRILAIGDYFQPAWIEHLPDDGKELYRRRAFYEVQWKKDDNGKAMAVAVPIKPDELQKLHPLMNVLHESEDRDKILGSGGIEKYDL